MTVRTNPHLDDDLRSSVLSLVVFVIEDRKSTRLNSSH